jgi:hypothetical protein
MASGAKRHFLLALAAGTAAAPFLFVAGFTPVAALVEVTPVFIYTKDIAA